MIPPPGLETPQVDRWSRAGLLCGAAAAAVLIVTDLLDALLRPGYSILRHWVSHRALGHLGWVGAISLLITALLLLACAVALVAVAGRSRRSGYPTTVGIVGLALAVAALSPMDPSLGFPPGIAEPASPTLHGRIHDVAGPVFILGLAVAAFLSRRFLRTLDIRPRWAGCGRLVGAGIIAAFAITSVLVSLDYAEVLPGAWSGLFERIAIYAGVGWNALVVCTLDRRLRHDDFAPDAMAPGGRRTSTGTAGRPPGS